MDEFNSCIHDCFLADLKSMGQTLSWSNSSKSGNLKLRRLDRALVNEDWLCNYPSAFATHLNPSQSDHSPFTIQFLPNPSPHNPKPFCFHNMWLEEASLFEVVERAWTINPIGNPMFRLVSKLKEVKKKLPEARAALDEVQTRIAQDPTNLLLRNEEIEAKEYLNKISYLEESCLRQKSRIDWLNLGDTNSAFFHSAIAARRNTNSISALKTDEGDFTLDHNLIASTLVNYFKSLLNQERSPLLSSQVPEPSLKINSLEADYLTREVTAEEIHSVVMNCDGSKAPGPDGFNGQFFQSFSTSSAKTQPKQFLTSSALVSFSPKLMLQMSP
ncbi:uncharacterized protein LOC143878801 [Tasmannia lanceolata]|uniref:uncharacterized protein LOC143878801 n=1 Tax=Tasmannia lanceolata TaxID=3420 RepID=UPI0040638F06